MLSFFAALLPLWGGSLAGGDLAHAAPQKACFDFSRPVVKPLRSLPSLRLGASPEQKISQAAGERAGDLKWAAVRGEVPRPLSEIVEELKSHEITKSGRVSEMNVVDFSDPHFLARQKVVFTVKPFLFIEVNWTEDWAFTPIKTERGEPTQILVAYEKTEGTSHIKHLCGTYELQKIAPDRTLVTLYEEAIATQRSKEDTLNGIRATLEKLARPRR